LKHKWESSYGDLKKKDLVEKIRSNWENKHPNAINSEDSDSDFEVHHWSQENPLKPEWKSKEDKIVGEYWWLLGDIWDVIK
jgi:hypothetical protein